MRRVKIFSGTSHPGLTEAICERLGTTLGRCDLKKFSNGETSVDIGCSIRDQDVFIVQSGSAKANDSIMELLILISACKGGSANKITAVMPYFPYSKQSKKKSHRGAITARMLANLLTVAGVDHVITVDLHASQMQGFFTKPVDNLYAEPLLARWIRHTVPNWRDSVVVSKNPGGTKRVTQLADVLKLNFALITTDRRRKEGWASSRFQSHRHSPVESVNGESEEKDKQQFTAAEVDGAVTISNMRIRDAPEDAAVDFGATPRAVAPISGLGISAAPASPPSRPTSSNHSNSLPPHPQDDFDDDYTDDHAQSVTYGRLIQGHIVDDDYPSPSPSIIASTTHGDTDHMMSSIHSLASLHGDGALGGSIDANDTDEEEDADQIPGNEKMITLVGEVRRKTVLIVDDMIDRAGSWISAAEHVKLRGGAKKVICIATHGVFGGNCLKEMEDCSCIDQIVVTNSFPIPEDKRKGVKKLVTIDLSQLLSEAIRRNHHGESISALFQHYSD
ncbi:ribose-phosphate pyrophosphokinase 1 [Tuber indicum]|nr:ribose-phosphate pyrophosphokinase 1 [Tuber indicum]